MTGINIQQQNGLTQDARSILNMNPSRVYYPSTYLQATLHPLLDQIVRESAEKVDEGYWLDARDLSLKEKQLVLSHILDSEDYEDIAGSLHSIDAIYRENQKFIQRAIDWQCEESWRDHQWEMAEWRGE